MSKVNLFVPCAMDMYSPLIPNSVINILEKIGDTVVYNPEQTCCGRCLYYQGENENSVELANKLLHDLFDPKDFKRATVIPSSACAGYIKNYYKSILQNTAVIAEVNAFTQNVFDLCDYIVNVKKITKLNNSFNGRVFYYNSCSARNLYKLDNEPEILLRNTNGVELLIDSEVNTCCGANGTLASINPDLSDQMLSELILRMYNCGAQYITSTDIHCLQHIDAYISTMDINVEVVHIADILNNELS
jgi:L-lactate dehydrogenase complex protein LldE